MEKRGGPKKLAIESEEVLIEKIDAFFKSAPMEEWTITGLAISLGISTQTLWNYGKSEVYGDIVEGARTKVEHAYELALRQNGKAGEIFALKNMGWRDKRDVDHTTNGKDMPAPILGGLSQDDEE